MWEAMNERGNTEILSDSTIAAILDMDASREKGEMSSFKGAEEIHNLYASVEID